MKNKITLFLMSYKGYYVLQGFLNDFDPLYIEKIISARDSNVEKDYFEEIKDISKSFNIPFFHKDDQFEISTKYVFAISWRWLIKINKELIILHDSILPRYRGFSPLVNSLINSEKFIGVTALLASEEYDEGNIIEQKSIKIDYPIKIFEAIQILTPLYYEIFKNITTKIFNEKPIVSITQDNSEASYCIWRDEEDYRIDWKDDSRKIRRLIDALGFPFLGASSYMEDVKVRILEAEEMEDVRIENRDSGKVIFLKDGNPVVICGKGLLKINSIIEDKSGINLLPFRRLRIRFK